MRYKILTVLFLVMTFLLSSCACYHCPRVYKNRVGIPTSVEVPYRKNTKQNKYGPNNPYYGSPKKKQKNK